MTFNNCIKNAKIIIHNLNTCNHFKEHQKYVKALWNNMAIYIIYVIYTYVVYNYILYIVKWFRYMKDTWTFTNRYSRYQS